MCHGPPVRWDEIADLRGRHECHPPVLLLQVAY